MIHYYYGRGKGKTSAAVGAALRFAAYRNVYIFQFLKDGSSGEIALLKQLEMANIQGIWHAKPHGFYPFLSETEQMVVQDECWSNIRTASDILKGMPGMLVLDEIGDCVQMDILNLSALTALLRPYKASWEIIMTGHSLIEELRDLSDYCTHFVCDKHPYDQAGHQARRGVEF